MGEFSYLGYDQAGGEGSDPFATEPPMLGYQQEAQALVPENTPMLGAILLEQGVLTQEALDAAIARQGERGESLAQVLLDGGLVAPDQLVTALQIRAAYG